MPLRILAATSCAVVVLCGTACGPAGTSDAAVADGAADFGATDASVWDGAGDGPTDGSTAPDGSAPSCERPFPVDPTSVVDVASFYAAERAVLCDYVLRCGVSGAGYTCDARHAASVPPGAVLDVDLARACIEGYLASGCDYRPYAGRECDEAVSFPTAGAAGQPCETYTDCQSRSCTATATSCGVCGSLSRSARGGPCGSDYDCETGLYCVLASCGDLVADGGVCADDTACAAGSVCLSGHCAPLPTSGACVAAGCAEGFACVGGSCVPAAALGMPCDTVPCGPGLLCDGTVAPSRCRRAIVATGCACAPSDTCVYGACVGGVCALHPTLGDACDATSSGRGCAHGVCVGGICRLLNADETGCRSNFDCAAGLVCPVDPSHPELAGTCADPAPSGAACAPATAQCAAGLACVGGTCVVCP